MYHDLEKKFNKLKEDSQNQQSQPQYKRNLFQKILFGQSGRSLSSKSKNFEELSKTASQLRHNLKLQIEEVELTRKRLEKEKEDAKIFSISKFAKEILEVQDNLQRALDSCKKEYEGKENQLFEGTNLTFKVLEATLQRNGIQQDNPMDQKFDANKHEALFEMDHDKIESGKIAYVATVGYKIGDRVLRPAKVGVVKKKQQEVSQEEPTHNNQNQQNEQEQSKKKEQ